jgi:molybdate transport system substrate-binding protein
MKRTCAAILSAAIGIVFNLGFVSASNAKEDLVIATSPSLAEPVGALGRAYEAKHPEINVRVYFDNGLDMRRSIAAVENRLDGKYLGKGPFHLIAPGGDELISRLEQKYYVLPGTRRPYLAVPLVLVVPESLVDAPTSFEALALDSKLRVAIADPVRTQVGRATKALLDALGLSNALENRLDVASDAGGVLDHVLGGQADVGILYGSDVLKERERVRIVAIAPKKGYRPVIHSMAMERYCPNRKLCEDFLGFIQTSEAQMALKRLGYETVRDGQGG